MISTVLVTGGTGFIGSHVVEQLLKSGYRVRCLVRSHHQTVKWLHGLPVEIVRGDLQNIQALGSAVADAEYIVHIAGITKAKKKQEYFSGNTVATGNLLEAACRQNRLKKFLYLSSLTAAGPSPSGVPLTEDAPCRPITPYGKSKLEAEILCRRRMTQLPIVILRPPAVFGPRDTDILEMFKWVSHGIKPVIGSPEKTLSLIYAPDLAQGVVRALAEPKAVSELYNISDSTVYTFSSLIEYIAGFVHKQSVRLHLPKGLVYSMAGISQFLALFGTKPAVLSVDKARDLVQKHWVCSPQKIADHIGYRTSTSIFDGMDRTFRWYQKSGWL